MDFINLLIPIALFAMIFGIVYIAITTSHREKMAMIEAGMDPNENKGKSHNKLRGALLFVFVPLGIIVGKLVHDSIGMEAEVCQLVFAFLFGGLGLTVTYIVEKTVLDKKDNSEAG